MQRYTARHKVGNPPPGCKGKGKGLPSAKGKYGSAGKQCPKAGKVGGK